MGRWGLVSFEIYEPGKPPTSVKGQGVLTYDDFGNLDVQIRVDPETAELLRTMGIRSDNGRLSTSGRTAIDQQNKTLTYTLQGQAPLGAPSGPLALNRRRHYQVEGNILTLTTKADDGRDWSTAKWQKMQ
jgi:hypothetical protein